VRLSTTAFEDGKSIPTKYAHQGVIGGKNLSIPLAWKDFPEETKSFALSIVDPHPVARNWVHWLMVNLPVDIVSLPEGVSLKKISGKAKELYNSYGELGYGGPEPPKGSGSHPYVITIYALDDDDVDMTANTTLDAFLKTLEGKILATAKITGYYER
jgi:Raf kinase inhibitor-like YbhB/YbcL family protein